MATSSRPGVALPRFRFVLIGGAGLAALDAFARTQSPARTSTATLVVLLIASAAAAARSRRRPGRSRRAWIFMSAALATWAAGIVGGLLVPRLADAGRLGFVPLAAVAFASIPVPPKTLTGRSKLVLDAVIVLASTFALSWNVALGPVFRSAGRSELALAYPLGDIVLVALVLFVGARVFGRQRATIARAGSGIVAIAVSNTLTTLGRTPTGLAGVGWTAGCLLIAVAALRPDPVRERAAGKGGALVPYLPIAIGVPIQVAKFIATGRFEAVAFAAGMVLFVAVALRQLVYAIENRALVHDLEHKVGERTADLMYALEQLREAAARQEEFVSHASHELFTPLTTLVGTIDLLLERHADEHLLEMASRAARRMSHLVDDLMLATRLNGFVACERTPFDIPGRLRLALAFLDVRDKTIETKVTEGLSAIGDAERFQTALGHVLSNAATYGPPGSTITIDARVVGDDVRVVVADEGPGVPAGFREVAFERFSQLDASDARRHDGLGLGLFLARQVMRAMGGDVAFEDASTGCRVRLSLPRAAEAPSDTQVHAATSGVRRTYG